MTTVCVVPLEGSPAGTASCTSEFCMQHQAVLNGKCHDHFRRNEGHSSALGSNLDTDLTVLGVTWRDALSGRTTEFKKFRAGRIQNSIALLLKVRTEAQFLLHQDQNEHLWHVKETNLRITSLRHFFHVGDS